MNQIVIRVLWPQVSQQVLQWRCEYSVSSLGDEPSAACILDMAAAFSAAAEKQLVDSFDVVVLLPGEIAILNCVQLPARNQRQAMQALPFVVEEQLADDIEEVHLSVGSKLSDGTWPALVVSLAIMESIATICEQVGLCLKAVYVDAQLLPVSANRLSILLYGDRVLFRSEKSVAVFDLNTAASMIHFLLGESTLSHVHIRYQTDDERQVLLAQQLSTEFSALGDTHVVMDAMEEKNISRFLLSIIDPAAINLLQGRFTVRQPSGKLPFVQMVAAVGIFIWLFQLVLQLGSGWYFNHQAVIIEGSMAAQYRKWFPDAKHVDGTRKRLESRLLAGNESNADNTFAKLFSGSVQALNGLPNHAGLTIEELRYESQHGQLELELKAQSIDQLDQFKQALAKLGLAGKISSANDSNGSISGRMQITKE